MSLTALDIDDVYKAEVIIRRFLSPIPLIRSYALERQLGLPAHRRVWIKDYGWTPVGSFKLLGAINWVANHFDAIAERPVAAHSSGNFASGLAFAGKQFAKRVIIVMPDTAPKIKFQLTRSLDAEIRTYDISTDHITGMRDKLALEVAEQEQAVLASPYDDPFVIAGNGVGGLEITRELKSLDRSISQFVCPVSGGGLMAGHALAIHHAFPESNILAVEPAGADDFRQSLATNQRVRIEKPTSICDGLLSYDVGETNWPILKRLVSQSVVATDSEIKHAMKWLWKNHGLRTEPSGAIAIAACLEGRFEMHGQGDIVLVISGRNIDDNRFIQYLGEATE